MLLKTNKTNKPNISQGMQWFGTTYTRRYTIKHKRNGHLFQGRFKNLLVQDIPGKRICEDFRHGLFLGSQKFVDNIRSTYLSEKPDVEIPRKRYVLRVADPKPILEKAVKVLRCNTNNFLQSARICDSGKLNRDLLIYLLRSTGWYNNREIGTLFGLGYSSISRRVTIMKSQISKDAGIHKRLEGIKSRIKV